MIPNATDPQLALLQGQTFDILPLYNDIDPSLQPDSVSSCQLNIRCGRICYEPV